MTAIFIPSGVDRPNHLAPIAAEQLTGMINARYAREAMAV